MRMFHDYTILTTHTINNKLVERFKIDRGIIKHAAIFFPNGCHGLIHAKLFYQDHQILPRNQEFWCHGNNGWWESLMNMRVDSSPMVCTVRAYALNTLYNHTITVTVEVVPFGEEPAWDSVTRFLNALSEALGVG